MTEPAVAAGRFGMALGLGLMLGIIYSFLRPLRRRRNAPADGLFLLAVFVFWVFHSFRICAGDIRPAGLAGLALGCLCWEWTAGKWLRPAFFGFWNGIFFLFRGFLRPFTKSFQKFFDFLKILFASWKKWVTIKWNNRRKKRRVSGGTENGATTAYRSQYQSGRSARCKEAENCPDSSDSGFRGGTGRPGCRSRPH
jgi:hypothetical protein